METATPRRADDALTGCGFRLALGRSCGSVAVACLLCVHALLIGLSLPRNSVTMNEVCHLPAGMSYWHLGEFCCYHQNPPLVKLAFALPAVLARVPTDYRHHAAEGDTSGDALGRDFMLLNSRRYMAIFVLCRLVVLAVSVLGGYLVFVWARDLFGTRGGVLSLCLWAFCPEMLAHGGLVTVDMGATVVGLAAGYGFWRYLKNPSFERALLCGALLGLAEGSKFTLALLPPAWLALVLLALCTGRLRAGGQTLPLKRVLGHAAVVCAVSLYVLNALYLFEGTGRNLGSFQFRSRLLAARARNDPAAPRLPGNRFRGTMLAHLPVPFPEHYLLGFDDQMSDVDGGRYYMYLRGELRRGDGWFYYYLYYLAVKTPVGMIGLMLLAVLLALWRREYRAGLIDEACLIVPALAIFIGVSSQTGMNFGRYVLPVYPYLFILTGRLGPFLEASHCVWTAVFAGVMIWTVADVISVFPYFLTYFNEAVGGPRHGLLHLAQCNIDWGQGLLGLKDWLREHAPGRDAQLAYCGSMFPEIVGIHYALPPFGVPNEYNPGGAIVGPVPGLQAVSANYLIGFPDLSPNGKGSRTWVPAGAYQYYRRFQPIAVVGHSIYVYDIDLAEANRVRREMGLPEMSAKVHQE